MIKIDSMNPFDALLDIGEQISRSRNTAELLEQVMDLAMEVLAAERGFLLLTNSEKKRGFEAVTARNISEENIAGIRDLSTSVVNKVLESGEPVLTFDASTDERFSGARSIIIQKIQSIVCTPLKVADDIIGAIYMDSQQQSDRFTDEGLQFLQAFSRQAAMALSSVQNFENLNRENRILKRQIELNSLFPEIIGKSRQIRDILEMVMSVAPAKATVLIEGESGTGKELVAKALHYHSPRREKLFVPVFCNSLSENLLESELFGHKRGAFTGAVADKPGLFEEADGGTVFLDEIGDINFNIQTKLLRVIQEGEIKRVGDAKTRKVNVRIVSATNKSLADEVREGRFREDLFYRLNVINLKMPPLRERQGDVPILAQHFLAKFTRENGKHIKGFEKEALQALKEYRWPGNIRELENTIERAVILTRDAQVKAETLNLNKISIHNLVGRSLEEIEKAVIIETLQMTGNHRTRTAEILGVSRRWLQYRIKEWGINEILD